MRIAYVCADPGVPVFGSKGASNHVQAMLRAFGRLGHEVTLFARRTGGSPPDGLLLAELVELGRPPAEARAGADRERWLFGANETLARLLAEAGPFDLVYERHALFSFSAMESARAAGVPALLEVNAPLVEEQARHRSLANRPLAEAAARRAWNAAHATLAVSSSLACWLQERVDAPERVHVVPNGVDLARFEFAGQPAPDRRPVTVGFVGSLRPWHGLDTLADAFAAVHASEPNTQLHIVGDGPGREDLAARLDRLGVSEAAHFLGAVAPERVPAAVHAFDVAVAPYPPLDDFYFSPLKLYEYMAAGRPVVASAIGQVCEVIEHERDGLLVPPGNAEAAAGAILRLVHDGSLRERLSLAASAKMRGHDWLDVARRVLELAPE